MVCKLPSNLKRIISRYDECLRTSDVSGEETGGRCTAGLKEGMRQARSHPSGQGAYRTAFTFDGGACTVKVERDIRPDSNREEAQAYDRLPRKARKFFVPVTDRAENYRWIVQPTVAVLVDDDRGEDEDQEVIDELSDDLASVGISCADLHNENVGYDEGRYVVLDYGFGISGKGVKTRRAARCRVAPGQMTLRGFAHPKGMLGELTLGRYA